MLVVLLALPALRADDKPKEEKKPPTPMEQYQDLLKDVNTQRQELIAEINKAKGTDRQKLIQKYTGLGKDYAEKFFKLADDNPKDPAAAEAYFWVLQNAAGSPQYKKAEEKATALVSEMPLSDLAKRLATVRGSPKVVEAVYERAEKDDKDPAAVDVLFWVLQNGRGGSVSQKAADKVTALIVDMPFKELVRRLNSIPYNPPPALVEAAGKRAEKEASDPQVADLLSWLATAGSYFPAGQKATAQLIEKFPDHPSIDRVCSMLANGRNPHAADLLKQILEKTSKPSVRATATFGLGKALTSQVDQLGDDLPKADKLAAEAEKYFVKVIDEYGADNANLKKQAEQELKGLRTFRVGKVAPEISAPDLDEKTFKLSDYRGKVVLLDFWGNW